ncbi:trypsin-like serine protease [Marinibacterium profundimaris]|uniref:Peptidase S1 domain-containing protein n=1 Tax=Marinibacterium profundimaris TaxID=1679460 RepID=A0A225NEF0_9RHOB|nr:trypsin-like serine protease [Marinibacterium profundimaris]OWU70599.1 hypothetical protein ATO3_20300 [Marinibacterium profundimaris]
MCRPRLLLIAAFAALLTAPAQAQDDAQDTTSPAGDGPEVIAASPCNGDSGGPLMMRTTEGDWAQVGIVSWGRSPLGSEQSCGHEDLYAVYTRISTYRGWIARVIEAH